MAFGGKSVEPQNFVLLDGLRGVGALLVVFGHTMAFWGPVWACSGAVVVDLFFLLSGFVIAYSYEPQFRTGMGVGEFMIHRIVRLYPLYLLGTVLGFLTLLALTIGDADGGQRSLTLTLQFVPQLFLLPAPEALGSADLYPLNVPAWTLFFEFAVNLVYVLTFRWLSTRVLVGVVAFCGLVLAWRVLSFGGIDAGSTWETMGTGFARAGFGFFSGVLAFRLLGSPVATKRPSSKWAFAILVAIPVVCFLPVSPMIKPFTELAIALCGVAIIFLALTVEPPKQFARLFIRGGQISYAVYILQQPIREIADRIAWRSSILYDMAPLGGIAIMVAVLALGWFAEKYYDRPVRRWIVRQLKIHAASRAAAKAQLRPADAAALPTFAE